MSNPDNPESILIEELTGGNPYVDYDMAWVYDQGDPRRLTDAQRDELARDLGKSREYVESLIERIGRSFDQRAPEDIPEGAITPKPPSENRGP